MVLFNIACNRRRNQFVEVLATRGARPDVGRADVHWRELELFESRAGWKGWQVRRVEFAGRARGYCAICYGNYSDRKYVLPAVPARQRQCLVGAHDQNDLRSWMRLLQFAQRVE